MARAAHLGPARRREPIIEAAAGVFAEAGYEAASMTAVATAAGVTKPVVYACFPGGKHELYLALLDWAEARWRSHLDDMFVAVVGRGLGLEGALRVGVQLVLDVAEDEPHLFRVTFGAVGTSDPGARARYEAVREQVVSQLTAGSAAAGFTGGRGIAAELYWRSVVASVTELARWSTARPELDRARLVDALVAWFVSGFDGVLAQDRARRR